MPITSTSPLSSILGGLNKKRHAGRAVKAREIRPLNSFKQPETNKIGYQTTAHPFVTPVTGLLLGECFSKGRKELVVGSRGIR